VHRLMTIVAISALVVGACSGSQDSDRIEEIEEQIRADVFASTNVETIVRCPEDATTEPDATFECYVSQANGQTGIAAVTIGADGTATFEPLPNPP
jgi:hypothetical protein